MYVAMYVHRRVLSSKHLQCGQMALATIVAVTGYYVLVNYYYLIIYVVQLLLNYICCTISLSTIVLMKNYGFWIFCTSKNPLQQAAKISLCTSVHD